MNIEIGNILWLFAATWFFGTVVTLSTGESFKSACLHALFVPSALLLMWVVCVFALPLS